MTAARTMAWLGVLSGALTLGCGADSPEDPANEYVCRIDGSPFATEVVNFEFGAGQDFGQDAFPARVLGGPRGGGCCEGSLDVTSLGEGGFVELGFDSSIVDGPGTDFLVFENAFVPAGSAPDSVFAEVGTVSVSQDGQTFHAFPCVESSYPFGSCAGQTPVLADVGANGQTAFDAASAGGDAFDLAELGLTWARYVRIEDRVDVEGTFDLDAVAIVNAGCP